MEAMPTTTTINLHRPRDDRLHGQVLRRSERREVAIFLRGHTLWIADFIDGSGELVDAPTWFRFNCGEFSNLHARHRMARESAIPLSEELVERIERLPLPASGPKRGAMVRLAQTLSTRLSRSRFATMVAVRLRRWREHRVKPAD